MNEITKRFEIWLLDCGAHGDLDISSEDLKLLEPRLMIAIPTLPYGTLRLWEENGTYATMGFIRQQILNNEGVVLSFLDKRVGG